MSNRRPIMAGYSALVVAALVSLFVVRSLQVESTRVAVLLSAWLLLPHAVLAVVLWIRAPRAIEIANVATTLLVAAGGVAFLILVVFVDSDPQGGIAVVLTPVYQGIATVVLLPLTRWLFGRGAHESGGDDQDNP